MRIAAAALIVFPLCALLDSYGSTYRLIAPAAAQSNSRVERTVIADRITRVDRYYSANTDCSARGIPQIDVVSHPAYGKLTIENRAEYPNFPQGPYFHCNTVRLPARNIWYRSQRTFAGTDGAQLSVTFPTGRRLTVLYVFHVVR